VKMEMNVFRKIIQNIIDDIENGYIRDVESCLETLKELIE
tara:strand:- start:56 stop:175 length:120 start_codon:yes stop_codon:yes gene_type:complete